MKCPRCVQPISPGLPHCSRCGFMLASLDDEFGEDVILLDRLTDAAHCLRIREKDALMAQIEHFERQFPQLFATIYLGVLPQMTSIRQFGFWLLNHAAISTVDVSRPNEQGILIVVDLQSRVVGITLGYMVESFLNEKDLRRCLKAARPQLFQEDYYRGVSTLLQGMSKILRRNSKLARKNPERFAPPPAPPLGKPLFRKLKDAGYSSPPISIGSDAGVLGVAPEEETISDAGPGAGAGAGAGSARVDISREEEEHG